MDDTTRVRGTTPQGLCEHRLNSCLSFMATNPGENLTDSEAWHTTVYRWYRQVQTQVGLSPNLTSDLASAPLHTDSAVSSISKSNLPTSFITIVWPCCCALCPVAPAPGRIMAMHVGPSWSTIANWLPIGSAGPKPLNGSQPWALSFLIDLPHQVVCFDPLHVHIRRRLLRPPLGTVETRSAQEWSDHTRAILLRQRGRHFGSCPFVKSRRTRFKSALQASIQLKKSSFQTFHVP